jgi:hypothetical protein
MQDKVALVREKCLQNSVEKSEEKRVSGRYKETWEDDWK